MRALINLGYEEKVSYELFERVNYILVPKNIKYHHNSFC